MRLKLSNYSGSDVTISDVMFSAKNGTLPIIIQIKFRYPFKTPRLTVN